MPHPYLYSVLDQDGVERPLGNRPAPAGFVLPCAVGIDVLPRSAWTEFELPTDPKLGIPKIKDQDGKGACNGHAAASSLEWARWLVGAESHDLSAWFVYAILCGGVDQGSSIAEALDLLQKTGTSQDGSVPYGTINPRSIPQAARDEAPRFRIEVGARLRTFDELMTACQLRRPFNFSLSAGGGFSLDSEGVLTGGPGQGDHALCGGLGAKKTSRGEWVIKFQNSWNTRWGQAGYGWFPERRIAGQAGFDAYEVLAIRDDPQDTHKPPTPRTA